MTKERKSVWGWAMYDWANSAFATTVMAGFFPLFFKAYWANPDNPSESTFYLGMANSIASIIVAMLAPFLGAIADRGTAKKKFLFIFAFLGIVMTGGLWMVSQGFWQMAILLYVLATVGFSGGNLFYDSLLPGIASEEKVDFVSSLGFALGYVGGGILFLINVLMYLQPDTFGIPDGATAIRLSFVSVAIWWAIFSIPVAIPVPLNVAQLLTESGRCMKFPPGLPLILPQAQRAKPVLLFFVPEREKTVFEMSHLLQVVKKQLHDRSTAAHPEIFQSLLTIVQNQIHFFLQNLLHLQKNL